MKSDPNARRIVKLVHPDQSVRKPAAKGAPSRAELASQVEALIRERDRLIANEIHLFETIDVLRQRTVRVLLRQEIGRLLRRYRLFPLADRLRRAVARLCGKKAASSLYPAPTLSFNAAVVEHGPFLISGNGDASEALAVSVRAAGQNMIRVHAGDGFAIDADRSRLEETKPGSLAAFLSDRMDHLGIVKTIVLDAVADATLLGLLKGRLRRHQRLLLSHADHAAELGEPSLVEHGFALFETLPDTWLDPLDDARVPIASRIATVAWPKISVVMVSFNQAQFVEEAIRSILGQDYPNLELIVIDGQSDDGSIEILERYRSHFDVLVIEPDEGQTDGLNKGLNRATGEIFTWLNSDDLLEPGALFRVAQAFLAYGTDMVVGGCRQIGLSRDVVMYNHHTRLPLGRPVPLPLDHLLDFDGQWQSSAFFFQPEVFFSGDIWRRSGGQLRLDLYYVLDYDLWVRMAAVGATIVHIPEYLACSRTHDRQKTTYGQQPYLPEVRRLLSEYSTRKFGTN